MKVTCISDTHNEHYQLKLGSGEVLIFAGDCTENGTEEEAEAFLYWFAKQDFEHKLMVAGNHDLCFENNKLIKKMIPKEVRYLQNSGCTIQGYRVWGSPVSPYHLGMAFNKHRGDEISQVWRKIPAQVDILVTHTPPLGILDARAGCESLAHRLAKLSPKLHVFGHIHERFGLETQGGCVYANASISKNSTATTGLAPSLRKEVLTVEI